MAVDIEDLQRFCTFGPDRVYLLMAIARAKENPETDRSELPVIREVVENADELPRKVRQLEHAMDRFDLRSRLYVSVNARDALAATFALRRRMDDWLEMRLHGDDDVGAKFKQIDSEYKSVLQSDSCKDETYFIFDLDDASATGADRLESQLSGLTTVSLTRETPNGYHIVTEPFNYNDLETAVNYELKTDGMLFLSYLSGR